MDRTSTINNIVNVYKNAEGIHKHIPLTNLVQVFDLDSTRFTLSNDERFRLVDTHKDTFAYMLRDSNDMYVKCTLLYFIERVCVVFPVYCKRYVQLVSMEMRQAIERQDARVIYTAINVFVNVYLHVLKYVLVSGDDDDGVRQLWQDMTEAKQIILEQMDATGSDMVRSLCIKFVETLILAHTMPMGVTETDESSFVLPPNHPVLPSEKLREESRNLLELLMRVLSSDAMQWSATNLGVVVLSLEYICAKRTQFVALVVRAWKGLQSAYPSHLSEKQRKRLQHVLKTALVSALELPSFSEKLEEDALEALRSMGGAELSQGLRAVGARKKRGLESSVSSGVSAHGPRSKRVRREEVAVLPEFLNIARHLCSLPSDDVVNFVIKCLEKSHLQGAATGAPLTFSVAFEEFVGRFLQPKVTFAEVTGAETNVKTTVKTYKTVPPVPVLALNTDQCRALGRIAFQRAMSPDVGEGLVSSGYGEFRLQLLGKLAAHLSESEFSAMTVVTHVLENFNERYDLCLSWLYNVWAYPRKACIDYDDALKHLLPSMPQSELPRLVVDLPLVSEYAMAVVAEKCEMNPEIGLACLRELTLHRPAQRSQCWAVLLALTTDERVTLRHLAIDMVVGTFLSHENESYRTEVMTHARSWAEALVEAKWIDPQPEEDVIIPDEEDDDDGATMPPHESDNIDVSTLSEEERVNHERERIRRVAAWEESKRIAKRNRALQLQKEKEERAEMRVQHRKNFIEKHLELFFRVISASGDVSLLSDMSAKELFDKYSAEARQVVHRLIPSVVSALSEQYTVLLPIIEQLPKPLALQVTHQLSLQFSGNEDLVEVGRQQFRRTNDVRFVVYVLSGLKKDEIATLVPNLCAIQDNTQRLDVFQRLLSKDLNVRALIDGWRLLSIGLMQPYPLENLAHQMAFLDEILSVVIERYKRDAPDQFINAFKSIVQREVAKIPLLFMRTVIVVTQKYPKRLGNSIRNVLRSLIKMQVWTDEVNWEGFYKWCKQYRAYDVLVALPPEHLDAILKKDSGVATAATAGSQDASLGQHLYTYATRYQSKIHPGVYRVIREHHGEQ